MTTRSYQKDQRSFITSAAIAASPNYTARYHQQYNGIGGIGQNAKRKPFWYHQKNPYQGYATPTNNEFTGATAYFQLIDNLEYNINNLKFIV